MPYRPKLDPKVDLAGATPETLVQALFQRTPLRLRPGGESVISDKPPVAEPAPHKPGDNIPHLDDGV